MVGGVMHVMIDLETMSRRPDAAICAIGAVLFDPAAPGDGLRAEPFYRAGLLADAVRQGGHMEVDTVLWWMQQDDAARAEICAGGGSLLGALMDLCHWMFTHGVTDVWGNGADFDLTILAGTYRRASIKLPWEYKQQRCLRERRRGHPELKVPGVGDNRPKHHALHDAIWGARMAVSILREEAQRAELAAQARKVASQSAMSAAMSADIGGDISGAPI